MARKRSWKPLKTWSFGKALTFLALGTLWLFLLGDRVVDPGKVVVAELAKINWTLELFCNFLGDAEVMSKMVVVMILGFGVLFLSIIVLAITKHLVEIVYEWERKPDWII